MDRTKFYSDAVQHFVAMADSRSNEAVDAAHFKMWCRVAANELTALRVAYRLLAIKLDSSLSHDQITDFLNNISTTQHKKTDA
jgi:hypothetical protein